MLPARRSCSAIVVTELFPPAIGGSAVLLDNIYGRLAGVDVVVLTDSRASAGASADGRAHLRIVHRPIATRSRGVLAAGALRHHLGVAREIAAIGRGPGTLVHTVRALPEGLAALFASVKTGTRYVCWCHGEEVATALTSRELTFLMRQVYRRSAGVIANSHHTATLLGRVGVGPDRITVVHPGVDAARFSGSHGGEALRQRLAPDASSLLLTVGRLQRRKGQDLVLQAIAGLLAAHPRLRYVIVGDGDERAALERMASSLGVAHAVVFAGAVADADLPAYYEACDVFVMPNRIDGVDVEGFGIVFLEAAAAGKPTIGGRSGGAPEAIAEEETGLLVGGTDVDELARAIEQLLTSAPLRERLGTEGRARAVRDFSWERAAASVSALHGRLAG